MGDILSRIDLSDLESKPLEYSLESDFDAYGSGFLSVALTEEQEAEAKELYRVLFLVLQDPDALKTFSFDKITKKKVRSYLKHCSSGRRWLHDFRNSSRGRVYPSKVRGS